MPTYTVTDGQAQSFTFDSNYQNQTDDIYASGSCNIQIVAAQMHRFDDASVTVNLNLAPNAQVTTSYRGSVNKTLNVTGDATTTLINNQDISLYFGDVSAPRAVIQPDVAGTGTFYLDLNAYLELGRSVASGITVNFSTKGEAISPKTLKLDQPAAFKGAINFSDGEVVLAGLSQATDYDFANGVLTVYGGPGDAALAALRFTDNSQEKSGLALRLIGNDVQVIEQGDGTAATPAFLAGTALTQHVAPPPVVVPPAAPQVAVHNTTTGADVPDTFSSAYSGPVSGISTQTIAITPDSLNVTALTSGAFIKTGAGNDAIAVHGGTNVVDAGTGSNFVTGGDGFDTFYLDARNISAAASAAGPVPGAIWDTIQNFGTGDAATLWSVGRGAALSWQNNGGAVGHTGLTLHANKANGTEASITFAGIDSKAALSLSYGTAGGVDYLYVKAV